MRNSWKIVKDFYEKYFHQGLQYTPDSNKFDTSFICDFSWGCTRGDCLPRSGNVNGEGVADVLLSLKHAVVHPGSPTGGYYSNGGSAHHYSQDYGQNLGPPVAQSHYATGPAMSVNVSMNMTMNMNMPPPWVFVEIYF